MQDEVKTEDATATTSVPDATGTSHEGAVETQNAPTPEKAVEPTHGVAPDNDVILVVTCQSGPGFEIHLKTSEAPGRKIIDKMVADSGLPFETFQNCQIEVEGGPMLDPSESLDSQKVPAGTHKVFFSWVAE